MWNKLNLIQAIPIAILIIFMFIPFYGSSITIEKPYLEEFNQCTEEKEILWRKPLKVYGVFFSAYVWCPWHLLIFFLRLFLYLPAAPLYLPYETNFR